MSFDEKYFSTHTYAKVSFAKFSQYWWSNRFFAILARRYGRRGSRVLEIGSGLGHLMGLLEQSFTTNGLDLNHWAVVRSKSIVKRTTLETASAQALPFPASSFGVVVIKHIIEHLPDPALALREINRVLEPGGVVILATPNLSSLLRRWKGANWIGYLDPTHISLKEPNEWFGLIESAGLCIVRSFADGFWNVPYIPLVPNSIQKLTFGALGGIQAMTGIILVPLRWGESVIVIARRK